MKTLNPLFLILLLLASGIAHSGQPDLYAIDMPIADDSPQVRRQALSEAFARVLTKASGHRDLKGRTGARKLLKRAPDYVQQFRYHSVVDEEGNTQRRLWVQFDQQAVQHALSSLGLSVWKSGRPEVLVWLAREIAGQRDLIDLELDAEWVAALQQAADERGMPLLLPLMDLQDRSALHASDIWSGDETRIRAASSRYGDAVILAGRLFNTGGAWKGKWTLFSGADSKHFVSSGKASAAAIRAGVNKVMDWLADAFMPMAGNEEAQSVWVRFVGVHDVDDFARIMQMLESLDNQSGVYLKQARDDQLLFQVRVRGGRDLLQQRLSLQGDLQPAASIPDDESQVGGNLELTYRLN